MLKTHHTEFHKPTSITAFKLKAKYRHLTADVLFYIIQKLLSKILHIFLKKITV
jgi:hypothetical protein